MGKCFVVADFGQGKTKLSAYRKEEGKTVLFSGVVYDTPKGGFADPEMLQMFSVWLEKLAVKRGELFAVLPVDEKFVLAGEADYPMGSSKEIAGIIKNNLATFIPEEAEQYHYDWRLVESYPSGHGHFQIAAVRKAEMDVMHEIAERKRFKLCKADITGNALENLAVLLRADKKYGLNTSDDAIALVDVGAKNSHVIVLSKDRVIENESVEHDFYRMDKIIMSTLGDLKADKNIIPELLKLNPSYTEKVSQYDNFLDMAATDIIRLIKQAVSGENRYRLSAVYFSGGLYKMPQLVSRIKESFATPCFAYPLGDFVTIDTSCIACETRKPAPVADIFATSFGALMGGMENAK